SGSLMTLGVLQQFVANDGDAWRYSLASFQQFFDRIVREGLLDEPPAANNALLDLAREQYSPLARHLSGGDLGLAERLGQRAAQLHQALSQGGGDTAFVSGPFGADKRRREF